MSTTDWLWLAFAVVGPLPLVWVWKWWQARRAVRTVEQIREYRRQKFGGFIVLPSAGKDGQREVAPLERAAPGPHPWSKP